MSIARAAEYVILKMMADGRVLAALVDYYINGESPADIAEKHYGNAKKKFVVRGYIQRVYEKAGNHRAAALVVRALVRSAPEILPRLPRLNGGNICPLCGRAFTNKHTHMRSWHKRELREMVEVVLRAAEAVASERRGRETHTHS